MARGRTLEEILQKVRAKARISLAAANNAQVVDSHKIMIRAEQDRLWEDYAWPHMRVAYDLALQDGQYQYDLPADAYSAADGTYTLQIDRVEKIQIRDGGLWYDLEAGIDDGDYTLFESRLDERSWPPRKWRADENDQIEIWPIPDRNGDTDTLESCIRIIGIRDLQPLVAESDVADLDDELLSDYVAGAILAAAGAKDAELRLESANKRYVKLKGKQVKERVFSMFGVGRRDVPRKPFIKRYVP